VALPVPLGNRPAAARSPATNSRLWQQKAAAYRSSSVRRGVLQLATSVVPLGILLGLMYPASSYSYWLALALAPIAAGFHVRTFIIMHDCAHGSFFPSRRANEIVGFITGVLTLFPFAQWRRDHAMHHASSGDLDRRGHGDILTLTVEEYMKLGWWGRLRYRAYRNPVVLFGFGPIYLFLLNRWHTVGSGAKASHIGGVHATNAAIALLVLGFAKIIGLGLFLLLYVPVFFIASVVGIWLFYVQHQFDGTYWRQHDEWDYATAALQGSSYYRLPRVLEWITGSIGLHHVHHIDPKIPNYYLRPCHDAIDEFHGVLTLTLRASLRSVKLKLWDTEQGRLVGFDAVRNARKALNPADSSTTTA
jgi:acyl-lipid omega-6 desaturase (Delta-12 desaturase)